MANYELLAIILMFINIIIQILLVLLKDKKEK